jgi:hypothetical protein
MSDGGIGNSETAYWGKYQSCIVGEYLVAKEFE